MLLDSAADGFSQSTIRQPLPGKIIPLRRRRNEKTPQHLAALRFSAG
jgi:hypothetical protein